MTRTIKTLTGVATGDSFTNTYTVQVRHDNYGEAQERLYVKLLREFIANHWNDMRTKAGAIALKDIPEEPDMSQPEKMIRIYYNIMGARGEQFDVESVVSEIEIEDDVEPTPDPWGVNAFLALRLKVDEAAVYQPRPEAAIERAKANVTRVLEEAVASGLITGDSEQMAYVSVRRLHLCWQVPEKHS